MSRSFFVASVVSGVGWWRHHDNNPETGNTSGNGDYFSRRDAKLLGIGLLLVVDGGDVTACY